MIVALAGHVDHGKTALIRALTGIATDRLPDEQRRGMTIDLGFAYLHQDNAPAIGFVDVPGHERFLPNMLAGVLGVDTVLLVVAADDGPMPQTLEHLAILRLTGVTEIDAVITKTDLVDAARVEAVVAAVRALLASAGRAQPGVHRVSSRTGTGIDSLRDDLLARARTRQARAPDGGFRMAIDRRFSLQGIGLVVTGTVLSGYASVGSALLLSPPHLTARVRTIHVQDRPAEAAQAGDRCALAITGPRIEAARVRRGHWLIAPELHAPTATIDTHLTVAPDQRLRHGRGSHLHLGASHTAARALILAGGDLVGGTQGFVRLVLPQPIAALFGDRMVLRDDATGRIVAGGQVVDPFPSERRGARVHLLARLRALHEPHPRTALARLLEVDGSADLLAFARARNIAATGLADGLPARVMGDARHRVIIGAAAAETWRARLLDGLSKWHTEQSDSAGPGQATLLRTLAPGPEATVAEAALADLLAEGAVVRTGISLHLPAHQPRLADGDEALWGRIRPILQDAALRPPRVRELMEELGLTLANTEAVLERLHRFGHLLRVAPNRYFLPETVMALTKIAADLTDANDGFTASEFNKRSGIGRNLTIELLEFLDGIGATQRNGLVRHAASMPTAC